MKERRWRKRDRVVDRARASPLSDDAKKGVTSMLDSKKKGEVKKLKKKEGEVKSYSYMARKKKESKCGVRKKRLEDVSSTLAKREDEELDPEKKG